MKNEKIIKIVQILLISQFILWLLFSFISFFWIYNITVMILMAINSLVFLVLAYLIKSHTKFTYWFIVFYIGLNMFLTIFDQMGTYDYIALALYIMIFIYIISKRKEILK